VLSADGSQVQGWITNASVLSAVAAAIGSSPQPGRTTAPDLRPGYQVLEVTLTADSPAAGRPLGHIPWPDGTIPVSVLRDRALTDPDASLVLRAGDRVSLLTPWPRFGKASTWTSDYWPPGSAS
jgi:chloride channel protein, CIC family